MRIKVDFDRIEEIAIGLQEAVEPDKQLRQYANSQLARYCEKYIPASQDKMLSMPVAITEEFVQYRGPYGHYQYMGDVYGPNIPIMENGMLVGFYSIPGKPKTKTDRKLQYSHDIHPLAQSHWDKAAMIRHKGDLTEDIRGFISRRYGNGK